MRVTGVMCVVYIVCVACVACVVCVVCIVCDVGVVCVVCVVCVVSVPFGCLKMWFIYLCDLLVVDSDKNLKRVSYLLESSRFSSIYSL